MKLYYPLLDKPIEFKENCVPLMVVENAEVLGQMIQELQNQILGRDGGFIFSENDQQIEIDGKIELLIDYYNLNVNSRTNLNKLYTKLNDEAISEMNYQEMLIFKGNVSEYLNGLIEKFDYDVRYEQDFSMINLFKAVGVEFEKDSDNLVGKLIDYIKIINQIVMPKCFVLLNLHTCMSRNNIKELYKYSSYQKINLLLVENRFDVEPFDEETICRIDNDLCII